jgi:hypothetical protein
LNIITLVFIFLIGIVFIMSTSGNANGYCCYDSVPINQNVSCDDLEPLSSKIIRTGQNGPDKFDLEPDIKTNMILGTVHYYHKIDAQYPPSTLPKFYPINTTTRPSWVERLSDNLKSE